MSNMKAIITACLIHANDNKSQWPTSLGDLLADSSITPQTLRAPYDEEQSEITAANADNASSYLYRDGTGLNAEDVVLCERTLREGGANFAFADGHVEWVDGPRAQELFTQMRRTAQR
jgi:prepilin-type processing-associated H-X9-DG protein